MEGSLESLSDSDFLKCSENIDSLESSDDGDSLHANSNRQLSKKELINVKEMTRHGDRAQVGRIKLSDTASKTDGDQDATITNFTCKDVFESGNTNVSAIASRKQSSVITGAITRMVDVLRQAEKQWEVTKDSTNIVKSLKPIGNDKERMGPDFVTADAISCEKAKVEDIDVDKLGNGISDLTPCSVSGVTSNSLANNPVPGTVNLLSADSSVKSKDGDVHADRNGNNISNLTPFSISTVTPNSPANNPVPVNLTSADGSVAAIRADLDSGVAAVRADLDGSVAAIRADLVSSEAAVRVDSDGSVAAVRVDPDGSDKDLDSSESDAAVPEDLDESISAAESEEDSDDSSVDADSENVDNSGSNAAASEDTDDSVSVTAASEDSDDSIAAASEDTDDSIAAASEDSDDIGMNDEDEDDKFKCRLCQMEFHEVSLLQDHHFLVHMAGSSFRCDVCDELFDTETELLEHMTLHPQQIKQDNISCSEESSGDDEDLEMRIDDSPDKNKDPGDVQAEEPDVPPIMEFRTPDGTHVKRGIKCRFCDKILRAYATLRIHERKHTNERPCECLHCDKRFADPSSLCRHIREVHKKKPVWECRYCLAKQYTYSSFERHKKVHKVEFYQCCNCNSIFQDYEELKFHGEECMPKSENEDLVPVSVAQKTILQSEVFTSLQVAPKVQKAGLASVQVAPKVQEAGLTFVKIAPKPQELASTNPPSEPLHKSPGRLVIQLHQLDIPASEKLRVAMNFSVSNTDKEINVTKPPTDGPCKCRYCDFAFLDPSALLQHMTSEHRDKVPTGDDSQGDEVEDGEKVQEEEATGYELEEKEDTGHEPGEVIVNEPGEVNSNEPAPDEFDYEKIYGRPLQLQCRVCSRVCKNSKTLRSHEIRKHNLTKPTEGPYKCAVCKKRFASKFSTRRHARIMHWEGAKGEPNLLPCKICSMNFIRVADLRNHEQICTKRSKEVENVMVRCCFCDHYFLKLQHRERHIKKVHDGCKVHICDSCPEIFASEKLLNNHLEMEHMESVTKAGTESAAEDIAVIKTEPQETHKEPDGTLNDRCELYCDDPSDSEKQDYVEEDSKDVQAHIVGSNVMYKCGRCDQFGHTNDIRALRQHLKTHKISAKTSGTSKVGQKSSVGSPSFTCKRCEQEFKSRRAFILHKEEKKMVCKNCDAEFPDRCRLAMHQPSCPSEVLFTDIVHEKGEVSAKSVNSQVSSPLQCKFCHKVFNSPSYVKLHEMNIHQGISRFNCKFCTASYADGASLNKHLRKQHEVQNRTDAQYYVENNIPVPNMSSKSEIGTKCKKCHKHMKMPHICDTTDTPFQCSFCVLKYASATSLNRHLKLHHGIRNRTKASEILNSEINVEKIDNFVKGKQGPKYSCPCRRTFINFTELAKHKESHKCKVCRKWFLDKMTLRKHEKVHWVTCNICNQGFVKAEYLESHRRMHFCCPICSNNFDDNRQLQHHVRSHSSSSVSSIQFDKIKCSMNKCPEYFNNTQELMEHLYLRHPSYRKRNRQCRFCPKIFSSRFHLVVHERIHTGEKPYTCSECGKSYSDPSTFTRHLKNIHGIVRQQKTIMNYEEYEEGLENKSEDEELEHDDTPERRPIVEKKIEPHVNKIGDSLTEQLNKELTEPENKTCRLCGQKFRKVYDRVRHEELKHGDALRLLDNIDSKTSKSTSHTDQLLAEKELPKIKTEPESDDNLDQTENDGDNDDHRMEENLEESEKFAPNLKKEIDSNEETEEHKSQMLLMCKFCKNKFPDIETLIEHEEAHVLKSKESSAEPQENRCKYCNWAFVSQEALKKHEKTHTSVNPYRCHICEDTGFATSEELQDHKQKSHSSKSPEDQPSKTGNRMTQLKDHASKETPSKDMSQNKTAGKRVFSCPFCSVKMNSKAGLMTHILTHFGEDEDDDEDGDDGRTEEINLSCNDGSKQTKKENASTNKTRCEKCQKDFQSVSTLNRHLRKSIIHRNDPGNTAYHHDPSSDVNGDDESDGNDDSFNRITCVKCNKDFESVEALNRHLRSSLAHQDETKNNSGQKDDNKEEDAKDSEEEEDEDELSANRVRCVKCNKDYTTVSSLNRHLRYSLTHQDDNKKEDQDEVDDDKDEESDLGELDDEDDKSCNQLICVKCNKIFPSVAGLNRHLKRSKVHQGTWCVKCKKSYANPRILRRHLQTAKAHQNDGQDVKVESDISVKNKEKEEAWCEKCCKNFSSVSMLNRHLKETLVHKDDWEVLDDKGVDIKPARFWCAKCQKSFPNVSMLNRHLRHSKMHKNNSESADAKEIVTGDKSPWCRKCEKRFYSYSELRRHLKSSLAHQDDVYEEHEVEKECFPCTFCDKSFLSFSVLKRHLKTCQDYHINDTAEVSRRPNTEMSRRPYSQVSRYPNTHVSRRPNIEVRRPKRVVRRPERMACTKCNRSYYSINELNRHLFSKLHNKISHADVRRPDRVVCMMCNKSYHSIQELNKHVNSKMHKSHDDYQDDEGNGQGRTRNVRHRSKSDGEELSSQASSGKKRCLRNSEDEEADGDDGNNGDEPKPSNIRVKDENDTQYDVGIKRVRGRPKKVYTELEIYDEEEASIDDEGIKRGRGRPRKFNKNLQIYDEEEANIDDVGIKRGRVRSKKVNNELKINDEEEASIDNEGIKRGRGRPKKVYTELEIHDEEEASFDDEEMDDEKDYSRKRNKSGGRRSRNRERNVEPEETSKLKTESTPLTQYDCTDCDKNFLYASEKRKHVKLCHEIQKTEKNVGDPGRPYRCALCAKGFTYASFMRQHNNIEHWSEIKPCDLQNKQDLKQGSIDSSFLTQHDNVEDCSENKPSDLQNKQLLKQGESDEKVDDANEMQRKFPFVCALCGKGFSYASFLRQHKNIEHSSEIKTDLVNVLKSAGIEKLDGATKRIRKPYVMVKRHHCSECEESFAQTAELLCHIKWVHMRRPGVDVAGSRRETHCCMVCGLSFDMLSKLLNHRKLHRHKVELCRICCRRYSTKKNLRRHIKTVHLAMKQSLSVSYSEKQMNTPRKQIVGRKLCKQYFVTSRKKYVNCDQCGKRLAENLHHRHRYFEHLDLSFYECWICRKWFDSYETIHEHILAHKMLNKPVKRDPRSFPRNKDLKRRKQIATNKEQYTCAICERHFNRMESLKGHCLRIHKIGMSWY